MISQQTVIQRRQRRKRQVDQLTIPIEQELSHRLRYEQYLALWALREPLAQALQAMRDEVYDITDRHCDTMVVAFQELLLAVKNCITRFNGTDLTAEMRPYFLIVKLSALHRILIDAQVLVENVRGQCRCRRLVLDQTGSYWHMRMYLHNVVREYQSLLKLLKQEHCTVSLSHPSATA